MKKPLLSLPAKARQHFLFLCIPIMGIALPLQARILTVGPGKTYAKPSLAAAQSKDNDTIDIDFGTYSSDACTWTKNNLLIRGVPVAGSSTALKYAHMDSKGANAQGKGIWVLDGKNTTVENIEFSGAKVDDENGAGMRLEGPGVIIRNCYFHDNENGILADGTEILIEYTEFNHNGINGVGQTHNIYISDATVFTLRYCYSHHAIIGHNVKSRAQKNLILYNRIMDETSGTSSYDIDLPNGGYSVIMGNVIQQGPDTDNSIMVAYGAEGLKNPINELFLINNTLVNDRQGGTFFSIAGGTKVSRAYNNLFVGGGTLFSGTLTDSAKNISTQSPAFLNRAAFDFRPTANSPFLDKGKDPGKAGDLSLTPVFQYVHKANTQPRTTVATLDVGAYEFDPANSIRKKGKTGFYPSRQNGKDEFQIAFIDNQFLIAGWKGESPFPDIMELNFLGKRIIQR